MKEIRVLFFAPFPLRFYKLVKGLKRSANVSCKVCYTLGEALTAVLEWEPTVAVVAACTDFYAVPGGEKRYINAWSREVLLHLRGVQSQGRDLPLAIFATPEPELGPIVVSVLQSFDVTFIVKPDEALVASLVKFVQQHAPD